MSWKELSDASPELSEFGRERFDSGVAYLATVRKDGAPRVHPVTPILGDGRLFLFMEPTSPKGHDLRRDGRYTLHCSVEDSSGGAGEFLVTGKAVFVADSEMRAIAERFSSYEPAARYVLFELDIDFAFSTRYDKNGNPVRKRWNR